MPVPFPAASCDVRMARFGRWEETDDQKESYVRGGEAIDAPGVDAFWEPWDAFMDGVPVAGSLEGG